MKYGSKDHKIAEGCPLVIENGGPKAIEQDSLGHGKIVGHFRALRKN